MTGCGRVPPLIDDSALPDAELTLLERARALIPLLAERAPAATAARQLPAETIAEYHAAGILRTTQAAQTPRLKPRPSCAISEGDAYLRTQINRHFPDDEECA